MKRKLSLGDLRVESFATAAPDGGARGTVRGNQNSQPHQCQPVWTHLETSCQDTCGLSCNGSCIATYGDCCPES